jgi:accessory gene regulator protein AgrB
MQAYLLWGILAVLIFIIWGLYWLITNFWPWLLGFTITWLIIWFFWPGIRLGLAVLSIKLREHITTWRIIVALRAGKRDIDKEAS